MEEPVSISNLIVVYYGMSTLVRRGPHAASRALISCVREIPIVFPDVNKIKVATESHIIDPTYSHTEFSPIALLLLRLNMSFLSPVDNISLRVLIPR